VEEVEDDDGTGIREDRWQYDEVGEAEDDDEVID
jgi:hypothetical protein